MFPKRRFHRLTLFIGLVFLTLLGSWWRNHDLPTLEAEPPKPQPAASPVEVTVYDANPQHLWNRLYAALYVRTTPDGKAYGEDQLDPLLWPSSKYLLTKPRHQQAIALLDEFLTKNGEKLIQDPLKRAMLQRDLWAIFDWLAEPHLGYSGYTQVRRQTRAQ